MAALLWPAFAPADEAGVVAALLAADRTGTHWPRPSQVAPSLDEAGAYRVQSAYVWARLAGAAPDGYKGGLTAPEQQRRYGLRAPVAGVLYPDGRLASGATVPAGQASALLVEAEIGWTLARAVAAPVADAAAMAALVEAAVPVLELPRVRFASPAALTGADLVAVDVAAALHVVGPPLPLRDGPAANALDIVLRHDGREVARAPGSVPMGDQIEALRWLVNRVLDLGWPIAAGQLFITGALAPAVPGTAGTWTADFGGLGQVAVRIPAAPAD